VEDATDGQGIVIVAADLGETLPVRGGEPKGVVHPLELTVVGVLDHLGQGLDQDLTITVKSTIPIARGLGSGAAVSTAIVRALAKHFSVELAAEEISQLVFKVEKLHHGTPSGIDNTVIAHERPVYFVRGQRLETFRVGRTLVLVIGDTGVQSPTREVVDSVFRAWQRSKDRYESLFDRVGEIAERARRAIETGAVEDVGRLMGENHRLLREMGVSSPLLDSLVEAARRAGAVGAKLSGAGRGGNVIALVTAEVREEVERALLSAGAERVIRTEVPSSKEPSLSGVVCSTGQGY
jgi:mevalonate kinase